MANFPHRTYTLGIDPGSPLTLGLLVDGEPSMIYEGEEVATQVAKPGRKSLSWRNNPHLLANAIKGVIATKGARPTVVIERVSMRPDQDMASGQEFVGSMYMAMGVCAGLQLPYTLVAPSVWKPAMKIKVPLKNPKEPARLAAIETWPDKVDLFKLKKHHNRAEAFLLARYFELYGEAK